MEDKGKRAKQDNSDNVTIKPPTSDDRGNAKSYTLSRLKRTRPELFQAEKLYEVKMTSQLKATLGPGEGKNFFQHENRVESTT